MYIILLSFRGLAPSVEKINDKRKTADCYKKWTTFATKWYQTLSQSTVIVFPKLEFTLMQRLRVKTEIFERSGDLLLIESLLSAKL